LHKAETMTTPEIVYKFRNWRDKNHVNFLALGEIYLASPEEINDPFDCRIPNDFSLLDTEDKRTRFIDKILFQKYSVEKRSIEQIKLTRKKLIQVLSDNSDQYQDRHEALYNRKGNQDFGIFSTSLIWDSIQMWSYYSNNHSGFCVGLDGEKLFESIPRCKSAPMSYSKDFPRIDPLGDLIQTSFESTHTKDYNWSHEKEYRYFSMLNLPGRGNDSRVIQLTKECFKEIIIGLQFPERNIEKIKVYAQRLNVPLLRIVKNKMSFKLSKKEI
jgi:hypothetical protein